MTDIFIGISTPNARIEEALRRHGATPVLFESFTAESFDALHGVVITGNEFDVPPHFYGEEAHPLTTLANGNARLDFELELIHHAVQAPLPLLAICGGAQLLNVMFDGSLHQHIADRQEGMLEHRQAAGTFHQSAHPVAIVAGTLLCTITEAEAADINSNHHQAIKKPGNGFKVNATAPDGTIEGIEYKNHPFLLGVQWHPEFQASVIDDRIFAAFVKAAGVKHSSF